MLDQDKKNLNNIFGFDNYKNNQQEIIKEVIEGKNILTVMPTGGGKSLCYQLPATLFDGLTLVVSPLIALMQSQVAQLQLLGIKACCLNSSNSDDENKKIIEMAKNKPINSEELEKIFGVGKAKLKKFGKQFINAINTN